MRVCHYAWLVPPVYNPRRPLKRIHRVSIIQLSFFMGQKMMELEPWDTDGLCDLKKREAVEEEVTRAMAVTSECKASKAITSLSQPHGGRCQKTLLPSLSSN
ncbi:hypothetical protein EK904_009694 [Melospiza melodia maxima]|nr:hypothetical protein EK904_009694 [Melospiza melodia maxima]